jgi:hypothetical protein
MRSRFSILALAPAFAFVAACNNDKPAADAALNNDLTLAAQARPAGALDSVSAAERLNGGAAAAPAAAAPAPVRRTTTSSTARRATSSSSGTRRTTGSSGGQVASQPREVTVKHTKRDAAIGAAAGAVIGATTSRDKVKGGIIGAAAGGILGAVIGNNVDKQKKPVP